MANRKKTNPNSSRDVMPIASSEFAIRLAVFSLLWLLLTKWQLSSLIVGVLFIIGASLLSLYLAPAQRQASQSFKVSTKLLSFLCYFSVQSLRGGWDIAKLAITPKSKISPGVVKYQTHLKSDSQVFAFMQVLSLLPGTVSAGRDGRELSIHVLDLSSFNRSDVEDCQQWVTHLVGAQKELPLDMRK